MKKKDIIVQLNHFTLRNRQSESINFTSNMALLFKRINDFKRHFPLKKIFCFQKCFVSLFIMWLLFVTLILNCTQRHILKSQQNYQNLLKEEDDRYIVSEIKIFLYCVTLSVDYSYLSPIFSQVFRLPNNHGGYWGGWSKRKSLYFNIP